MQWCLRSNHIVPQMPRPTGRNMLTGNRSLPRLYYRWRPQNLQEVYTSLPAKMQLKNVWTLIILCRKPVVVMYKPLHLMVPAPQAVCLDLCSGLQKLHLHEGSLLLRPIVARVELAQALLFIIYRYRCRH